MSRESAPSVATVLSLEHTIPTQHHSIQNTDTLNSLMSAPLNDIVNKGKQTKDSLSFSFSQNVSNNSSSLLGPSLKSQVEQGDLSKKKPHDENELMTSSLFSLANSSDSYLSGAAEPTKTDLMSLSLSSLANQDDSKHIAKLPAYPKNENFTENSLFTTSLSSLASQNVCGNVPGLQDTAKSSSFSETTLMSASLSSLSSDSHLSKTGMSPFGAVITASLSSLASQNELPLLPSNVFDNSKSEGNLPGTSLSSLANESNLVLFPENSSSASGHDLNQQLLETSLSALSISSLTSNQAKDADKRLLSSITSTGLDCIVFKETRKDETKITAHKVTKQRKGHKSAKKCPMLSIETTPRKTKKYHTRFMQNSLMRVKPSMFAFTLCHSGKRKPSVLVKRSLPKRLGSVNRYCGFGNIVPFNFQTPSPDDVIQMKQKKGFSH